MRFFLAAFLTLLAGPAFAVDIAALGRPLDDDTKPMVDRYVYFNIEATDKNVSLDRAILSTQDIEEWLRQRITDALTLNGAQYDQKIITLKRFFTAPGYAAYVSSLEQASLPSLLKEKAYELSAVVVDRPEIVGQGLRDITPADNPPPNKIYQYVWQARVPAILSYVHGSEILSYNTIIEVEVTRIPLTAEDSKVALNGWRFGESKPVEKPKDTTAAPVNDAVSVVPTSRFAF